MNVVSHARKRPRARVLVVATAIGAVVAGALVALSFGIPGPQATAARPTSVPSPTVSTHPNTAFVPASFAGWTIEAGQTSVFNAEVGAAADGGISLRVDSGTDTASLRLGQTVEVKPSTEYVFSALVSSADLASTAPGLAFEMGATIPERFDLSTAPGGWSVATWRYTTAKGETKLPLALVATGPVAAFRVDSLTMTEDSSLEDLMINGSFEDYSAPTQITNKSLIMATSEAGIGLAWRTPNVAWDIADFAGTVVAHGDLSIANGLGLIPLTELGQGYYTANLTPSNNALPSQQLSFMILDSTTAPSSTDDRFGVGVHINEPRYDGSELPAAQLGFRHARTDAYWSVSEKEAGIYSFPQDEDAKTEAFNAAGLDMLPISAYSNKLYDGGDTPSSATGIGAYAAYTNAVVEHFSPKAVEIYNEFNWNLNTSTCGKTASCYLKLLQPTVDKIRADRPSTTIVGPSTAHFDDAFMTELYQAGGLNFIDAVSFHPYDELNVGAETLLPILAQANDRIKEFNNGRAKPIWLTEMGWTSGKVGELNQANYLVRGQTIAFANGVERFYWYDLVNDNLDVTDGEGNFGLLRQFSEAVPAFAPKPAAMAQAILARKIANKAYAAQDPLNESTFSYVFGDGKATTRVAWATSPKTVTYASSEPVTVTTQFGKTSTLVPVDGIVSVALTDQVIYLDGALTKATLAAY